MQDHTVLPSAVTSLLAMRATHVAVHQQEKKWNFWPTVALFLMTFLMVSCEENPCCDKPFDIVIVTDDISMNEKWAMKEDQPLMEKLQALGHMVG
jgi:hypothetical protein